MVLRPQPKRAGSRCHRSRGLLLLALALPLVLLVSSGSGAADDWPEPPEVEYPSYDYDGTFTFARLRFDPVVWGPGPFTWGLDLKWNHDYPQAEQNFSRILEEITGVVPNVRGGNVLEVDDPRLFEHPWAYMCEVGFWEPTDEEVEILRSYLMKGGFLVVDDFIDVMGDYQWRNWIRQIQRVLPGHRMVRLDVSHPVFRTFFPLESLDMNDPSLPPLDGAIYGIYEDNDPSKRLLVVANYNMDVGDYWEWSDQEFYPVDLTQRGFKLGVNYVIYGLTR